MQQPQRNPQWGFVCPFADSGENADRTGLWRPFSADDWTGECPVIAPFSGPPGAGDGKTEWRKAAVLLGSLEPWSEMREWAGFLENYTDAPMERMASFYNPSYPVKRWKGEDSLKQVGENSAMKNDFSELWTNLPRLIPPPFRGVTVALCRAGNESGLADGAILAGDNAITNAAPGCRRH